MTGTVVGVPPSREVLDEDVRRIGSLQERADRLICEMMLHLVAAGVSDATLDMFEEKAAHCTPERIAQIAEEFEQDLHTFVENRLVHLVGQPTIIEMPLRLIDPVIP